MQIYGWYFTTQLDFGAEHLEQNPLRYTYTSVQ